MILKPDVARRIGWRARFVDPDSGRMVKQSLDAALTTEELRAAWAVRKSKELAKRREELEGGAPRATGTALDVAVKRFFDDHGHLRPSTIESYREAAGKFTAWAARVGLESADKLTGERLLAFRATVIKEKRRVAVAGGKGRGKKTQGDEPRSPATINRELRSVAAVLSYLRRCGLIPRITSDALSDGLAPIRMAHETTEYLRPRDLQKLLEAALRHDAEKFDMTREDLEAGTTKTKPKYPAVAPFVAGVLLTGLRLAEALSLKWSQVDLDAIDDGGRTIGEIRLDATTKTHRGRVVSLEVSPALRRLLAALKLRAGKAPSVFGLSRGEAEAARRRLAGEYGAPEGSNWQGLRATCESYLANAPGIFGAASVYRSAKQLGHSVAVAERHYAGIVRGIPPEARDLESAMQITEQLEAVIRAIGEAPAPRLRKVG
ncbi:MAG TPA: hypothetical protein VHE30_01440 [Polyangiaceae bacterium]|nr:hypothetical protein [Polyangiaceae bacterium]